MISEIIEISRRTNFSISIISIISYVVMYGDILGI